MVIAPAGRRFVLLQPPPSRGHVGHMDTPIAPSRPRTMSDVVRHHSRTRRGCWPPATWRRPAGMAWVRRCWVPPPLQLHPLSPTPPFTNCPVGPRTGRWQRGPIQGYHGQLVRGLCRRSGPSSGHKSKNTHRRRYLMAAEQRWWSLFKPCERHDATLYYRGIAY